jgi:predicted CXXCH cytochrome family protein
MLDCTLCHFEAPLDDAVVVRSDGTCLCLRCYHRETGTEKRMPKGLRRDLIAMLAVLDAA